MKPPLRFEIEWYGHTYVFVCDAHRLEELYRIVEDVGAHKCSPMPSDLVWHAKVRILTIAFYEGQ